MSTFVVVATDVVPQAFVTKQNAATRIFVKRLAALSIELRNAEASRPDSNRQHAGYEPCSSTSIRCEIKVLADGAGLEPATSGLTGRDSAR